MGNHRAGFREDFVLVYHFTSSNLSLLTCKTEGGGLKAQASELEEAPHLSLEYIQSIHSV
jgi:hypothetical protein